MNDNAGRSCPIRYRYGAARIAEAHATPCDVLYVVGGLYGNSFALDAIEAMAAQESGHVRICFNGDFNWFNVSDDTFKHVNQCVLKHDCTLGNVEAELGEPLDAADCGCAYPDHVDQGVVDRSNAIHTELKRVAQANPDLLAALSARPLFARYAVNGLNVAVVHGDADSLAGWRFDPENLHDRNQAEWRAESFAKANVSVFASSHTCSAAFHLERLTEGTMGLISNNGAAGMPSARNSFDGLITRVAVKPFHDPALTYSAMSIKGVWVEQLRVQIDQAAWQKHFLNQWPEGTAAHTSYFSRISGGN